MERIMIIIFWSCYLHVQEWFIRISWCGFKNMLYDSANLLTFSLAMNHSSGPWFKMKCIIFCILSQFLRWLKQFFKFDPNLKELSCHLFFPIFDDIFSCHQRMDGKIFKNSYQNFVLKVCRCLHQIWRYINTFITMLCSSMYNNSETVSSV